MHKSVFYGLMHKFKYSKFIGNNPMVGMTVAYVVAVEEAMKAKFLQ